ncbi:exo-alpha-sialidase [Luteolibacter ambystomatis]|uniref:exo-alpha-sialidase n=1 Tax=Luteolibacter ambystomatis TaxID=2824561 RepID=A0A975J060_9BACT|nr:sialidase family protein [Luteolibacter ambystomatis]QUE51589.1 exo-alpha-sialidase [Luteolibacter ambystomatis]
MMKSSLFLIPFLLTFTNAAEVATVQPVCPVLVGQEINPVLGFKVTLDQPAKLEGIEAALTGTSRIQDVERVRIFRGKEASASAGGEAVAELAPKTGAMSRSCDLTLEAGVHWFWLSVELKKTADIDGRVDAALNRLKIGGAVVEPAISSPEGSQRIGLLLRKPGDDKSKAYRIPGLVRTKKGTLLAAYDIRYRNAGDLPADIDVGLSRSTDGGKVWEPMRVAVDMGDDPKFNYDGVGDPCIFSDDVTGRVWIASLWSHGKRAWNGSGPGMTPDETGQLVLSYSDDDGRSWSKGESITPQVKNPEWQLLFNGPGTGITMKDGTLAVPAQYKAADGKPFSTMLSSKDRGKTWAIGTGVKSDTTEAQLVELADGSIMINCRDNRGGSRTIATTKDLGRTWTPHPTDRKELREPVCMGSLLRWNHPKHGDLLLFSNPDSTKGRQSMTVKLSKDQGMTWPDAAARLYDERPCFGYSCLAPAGDSHVGVLYEGNGSLIYLRLPLSEWFK